MYISGENVHFDCTQNRSVPNSFSNGSHQCVFEERTVRLQDIYGHTSI